MADAPRDGNYVPTLLGVSSSAPNTAPVTVYVDPTTHRLYVDASITVDKDTSDILIYANTAKDGSGTDYVPLVDTDGHLQVDVLSGGGAGTEYTEGDTDASITGKAMMMEVAADTLQPVQGTVADGLLVNLGTNNDVTANAGTNLNTSALALESGGNLAAAATSLAALDNSVDGNYLNTNMNVAGTDVAGGAGTISAQTIRVTIATDDEVNNLLGTIDADTSNISTKIDTLAGAVAGTEMQVDVLTLPSITIGTFPDNEPFNVAQWGGNAATAGAGSVAAGTPRVTHASDDPAVVSLQLIDDIIFTAGTDTYTEATSKGGLILAVRRDADTTLANTTNEFVPLQVDANGYLKVEIFDGGGSHTVDNNGTFVVQDTAAEASLSVLDDWDETDRAKVNIIVGQAGITAGAGSVAANTPRVTHASDDPVTVSLALMDDWDNGASDGASVSGDVAADSADAGEPVKIGGKAVDIGANGTDVSANDRVNSYFLRSGQQLVMGGHQNIVTKHIQVTDGDGAQTDVALVTVSAGTAIIVTRFSVNVDSATTATGGVAVKMGFGTANTPSADANTGMLMAASGLPAGGGLAEGDGSGILAMGASNEDLRLTCEDPVGGNIDIVVSYFTIAIG